jgi:hypothetical protein
MPRCAIRRISAASSIELPRLPFAPCLFGHLRTRQLHLAASHLAIARCRGGALATWKTPIRYPGSPGKPGHTDTVHSNTVQYIITVYCSLSARCCWSQTLTVSQSFNLGESEWMKH